MEPVPFAKWVEQNQPSTDLYYREAALGQFQLFLWLEKELGMLPASEWVAGRPRSPIVVATHRSKSVLLPVVRFVGKNGYFFLRNNFYDWNLCVDWEDDLDLPLSKVYRPPLDWNWYLAEMQRKREYVFRDWTDEEMEDPRILRVYVKTDASTGYWSTVSAEAKDRWLNRMTDSSWYERDWASGKLLVEGKMGPGCTLYVASRAFAEGLSDVVTAAALKPYTQGASAFTLALPGREEVLQLMRLVEAA